MFKVNTIQVKELEQELKTFADRALPFATKATVNGAAFETQRVARKDVGVKMVERNRFTKQSIRVEQARTLDIDRQSASVGSTLDYMADQEFGTVKNKTGAKGVAIPTGYSAGQRGQTPRTRLPRKPNKLANIKLRNRKGKAANRKQRNIQAIKQAAKSGNKYIYLDLGKSEGIFRVVGGARKPQIRMVYDLSRTSVVIPRNPWLQPAFNHVQQRVPDLYRKALEFQAKRHGLFR